MLERNGEPVALTGKAFEILTALLKRPGEVVDKETLLREVWPDTAVEENNLTVNVSWLRKALGEAPGNPSYIVTIPGRGYRFIGDVRVPARVSLHKRPLWADLLIAAAVLTAMLLFFHHTPPTHPSLAVLPFRVLNTNLNIDYLGVGMADSLITKLGGLAQITVRPLNSALHVADKDPVAAGRALGTSTVLSGTLQVNNDRARLNIQMVRVRDGAVLWSQTFDEQMTDPFALEDKISSRVAQSLLPNLSTTQRSTLAKRYTQNQEAWQDYLKGRYYASRYTEEGFRKSLAYFQSAIQEDPTYALAYSGLAYSYYAASNLLLPPIEAMAKAKAAAQRSAALDDSLAEAHVSLGIVASKFDWDWREAEMQFQKALTLDPNSANAHLWYGLFRAQLADFNIALQHLRRAVELDPLSTDVSSYLATTLYWARRYPESLTQVQKVIEFDPTYFPAQVSRAWVLEAQGHPAEAVKACREARRLSGSPWVIAALARALALAGTRVEAEKILRELQSMPQQQFVSGYDLATVHAAMGDNDRAFAALDEAYRSRSEWMSYVKIDPQLDSLRTDRRFAGLLGRMRLKE